MDPAPVPWKKRDVWEVVSPQERPTERMDPKLWLLRANQKFQQQPVSIFKIVSTFSLDASQRVLLP
jgi:hypothetical protein